ncbi:nitroreductase [Alcaligenes ammonioxydans]|jgi:nitroreductase|uniref:Putative NAD(P)H nitroreductase n=1 Tax=Alcaligenes ammonioxydans TaxID=2582914 RepID=A0ABX8SWJ0_9BURK|nr:nitroreductase [Alcaligenes ammonioxydans]QBH18117.1 nitroreductase [Alcaligenes faecalis]MCH1878364.1 nitroreductase [Alcaligenes ammonioxydans]QXX79268.1 nitroreductase [Alcaligenes ammonioxydans]WGQ34180.1 nitroreductase [Alcaligenes faecalis]HRK86250.1 nitroreductase [Alcaligenes faecalis]
MSTIDSLLSRRSIKLVQGPGPSEQELDLILRAAVCAPDHGRLQPWRFCLIRGENVQALGELAIAANERAGTPLTEQKAASVRAWLAKVPLLIAVASHIDHGEEKIPELERVLATGAAVSNMLHAAHQLGFGAFWSTGLGTYGEEVPEALGFDSLDYQFLGFVSVGTPIHTLGPAQRPEPQQFVTEWRAA